VLPESRKLLPIIPLISNMAGFTSRDNHRPAARRRSRGQTMTEFALVSPVLLLVLFGILESGLLLFSVGTARFAAGEAARQEAESGNAANADSFSIQVVRGTALGTTNLAQVQHIDIYKLQEQANGTLTVVPGTVDSYNLDGTPRGAIPWPSSSRDVKNGESDFLGVTIYYRYTWKTGLFLFAGPLNLNQSFAIRLEPQTY
jgi:Flp pilus assembly protein TadG